jgi:hypothetical protein
MDPILRTRIALAVCRYCNVRMGSRDCSNLERHAPHLGLGVASVLAHVGNVIGIIICVCFWMAHSPRGSSVAMVAPMRDAITTLVVFHLGYFTVDCVAACSK